LPCRVDNQCQLPALVVFGDRIAGNGTGKSALRADGEPVEVDAEGLEARVIQHEIDHLDGVLIVDRAGKDDRKAALRDLRLRA